MRAGLGEALSGALAFQKIPCGGRTAVQETRLEADLLEGGRMEGVDWGPFGLVASTWMWS